MRRYALISNNYISTASSIMGFIKSVVLLIVISCLSQHARAIEIVRMDFQLGETLHHIDIELFETASPITVSNFLNYVEDGAGNNRYDQSFIHRSVPGFIIQGGGFTFDPLLGDFEYDATSDTFTGGLQSVNTADDLPIVNESSLSGLSNLRGTIAMARTNDPDSATSQWFINLSDSNIFLDPNPNAFPVNHGYAVFGEVLDEGMVVADLIAAVQLFNLQSTYFAFGELPLESYTDGDPVLQENLVRLNTVRAIQRPIFKTDLSSVNFPSTVSGEASQQSLTFSNRGNTDLQMDGNSLSALSSAFSVVADTCSNNTLSPESVDPLDTCSITIEFSPPAAGNYSDTLVITPSVNPYAVSLSLAITGEAIPSEPNLVVENAITSLDFSDVGINTVKTLDVSLSNTGDTALNLISIALSGLDAGLFSTDDGCNNATILQTSESCTLSITFSPVAEGQSQALLTIDSNGGTVAMDLSGTGSGPVIDISVAVLEFETAPLNQAKTLSFTIENQGLAELDITGLLISGVDAADFSQENSCPSVNTLPADDLAANGRCTVTVSFTPVTEGIKNATLTVTSNDSAAGLVEVDLRGDGAGPEIELSHTALDFGSVALNASKTESFTITNLGLGELDITELTISGADAAQYSVASSCPSVNTLPADTLTENGVCTVSVTYLPVIDGASSALLSISSNDSNEGLLKVNLSGNGNGPSISSSTTAVAFGDITINSTSTEIFTIQNLGPVELEITDISITGADAVLFNYETSCPSIDTLPVDELTEGASCTVSVSFTPDSAGEKTATLIILSNDLDVVSTEITLGGGAVLPQISAIQQVDMGVAQVLDEGMQLEPAVIYQELIISNTGTGLLEFSSVEVTGEAASSFSILEHSCPGTATTSGLNPLEQDTSCTIQLAFQPLAVDSLTANVEIASNDPETPLFIIELNGSGILDFDGISDDIEQAAPNSGDANNDLFQDDHQNNVASFVTDKNVYVSIVSPTGTTLQDVTIIDNPSVDDMPASTDFRHGVMQYTVLASSSNPDAIVRVGILLPAGDSSTQLYKYGATPDNETPHWYRFTNDGLTGATYLGVVAVDAADGSTVHRNMFIVDYIDGQRGDDDLTVNGTIASVLSVSSPPATDSGSLSWTVVLPMLVLLMLSRVRCRY